MTVPTPAPALALRVNGRDQEAPAHWTVADLVGALAGEARMVAVERNGVIVPRARWAETPLAAGDRIELVRFVQGG
jgi:thiamine biosynthesis protein ThiS